MSLDIANLICSLFIPRSKIRTGSAEQYVSMLNIALMYSGKHVVVSKVLHLFVEHSSFCCCDVNLAQPSVKLWYATVSMWVCKCWVSVIIIVCTYPRDWLWHCLLNMETVK